MVKGATSPGLAGWLFRVLRVTKTRITRAGFWRIVHSSGTPSLSLKVGRYVRGTDELECTNPKSELTLNSEELLTLMTFISENHEPFKTGVKHYIPLDP